MLDLIPDPLGRNPGISLSTSTHSSFEYFALLGEGKDVIETDDSGSMGEDEGGSKNPAQLNHGDGGENAKEVSRLRSLSEPVDARRGQTVEFRSRYGNDKTPVPLLLLQSVLLAGAHACQHPKVAKSRSLVKVALFRRAKALFDLHCENNREHLIQAALLFTWHFEGADDIAANAYYWIGVACRLCVWSWLAPELLLFCEKCHSDSRSSNSASLILGTFPI